MGDQNAQVIKLLIKIEDIGKLGEQGLRYRTFGKQGLRYRTLREKALRYRIWENWENKDQNIGFGRTRIKIQVFERTRIKIQVFEKLGEQELIYRIFEKLERRTKIGILGDQGLIYRILGKQGRRCRILGDQGLIYRILGN